VREHLDGVEAQPAAEPTPDELRDLDELRGRPWGKRWHIGIGADPRDGARVWRAVHRKIPRLCVEAGTAGDLRRHLDRGAY
jgi:hypothetical protein